MKIEASRWFLCFSLTASALFAADAPIPTLKEDGSGLYVTVDRSGVEHIRGGPATAADLAEMAQLMKLPPLTRDSGDGDFLLAAPHEPAPETIPRPDVPQGRVVEFRLNAEDSKFYPGTGMRGATRTRNVSVYIPSQYVPGTPAALLVSQDALGAHNSKLLPTILDNMIADGRLPVMVAVFARSGGGDDRGSERGHEYDTLSGKFTQFVETELLPRVSRDYNITFTKDPNGRATIGGSSGGTAAFTMAWFHPELYRRVLTYTATFTNNQWPEDPATPLGAWDYHARLIPQSPTKPLRVWLQVNENDMGWNTSAAHMHNLVIANQRMAGALKAKGYHYQFVYATGAGGPYAAGQGHDDAKVLARTLPGALEWLWQGYQPPKSE